jgi:hypothetical protein
MRKNVRVVKMTKNNMGKVHSVRQLYCTGTNVTHFKTKCGKIRHVITDLKTTTVFKSLTCKICIMACKNENQK